MTGLFAWICAGIAALATLGAAYFFDKSAEEGIKRAEERAAAAEERAAHANERAATLEKSAAEARLETERLKSQVAWRSLSVDQTKVLERELTKAPGTVNLRYIDGDPEALYFAIQIAKLLERAHWQIATGAVKPNGLVFGVVMPQGDNALSKAFTSAAVQFAVTDLLDAGVSFNISTIQGAPTIFVGSRKPPLLK